MFPTKHEEKWVTFTSAPSPLCMSAMDKQEVFGDSVLEKSLSALDSTTW
jgi:hypothetical protein